MKYGFYPGCSIKAAAGFRESIEIVNGILGIEMTEIEDWNCCGATVYFSLNRNDAVYLIARVNALASRQGFDQIVTSCNACYTTLKKGNAWLTQDEALREQINRLLADEGLDLNRIIPVRHYLEVLSTDIDVTRCRDRVHKPYRNLGIATYYGCQLTRPYGAEKLSQRPQMLDTIWNSLGLTGIDYDAKTKCCGASHAAVYQDDCRRLVTEISEDAKKRGADVICAICPLCQFNMDSLQKPEDNRKLPVPYFTQIIALAFGVDPKQLGLEKLLISMDPIIRNRL